MFDIEVARKLCACDAAVITKHAADRLIERNIQYDDIKTGIMNGSIIESYPSDYPHPSALILGYTSDNSPIHTVVGISKESIQIITAYFPTLDKWEEDFMTRKVAK